jgi:hypothetical protein
MEKEGMPDRLVVSCCIRIDESASHLCKGHLSPEPPKQTSTYLIYWKKPEEWGSIIYDWVSQRSVLV